MHWLLEETDCFSFETFDTIWLTNEKIAIDNWLFHDNFWPYFHQPALLLNEGIPRALKGKKLRLKNILLFPLIFEEINYF